MRKIRLDRFWVVAITLFTIVTFGFADTDWGNSSAAGGNRLKGTVMADFDGDGEPDLACIETEGYLYVKSSKYAQTKKYHVCYLGEPTSMIQGDFDGKQGLDIITGDSNGDLYLFHNDGQGGFSIRKKTKLGHVSNVISGLGATYNEQESDYDLIATFSDESKAVLRNVRRYYESKLFLSYIN